MHPDTVITDLITAMAIAINLLEAVQPDSKELDYLIDVFNMYKEYGWCYLCDELINLENGCKHIEVGGDEDED